QCGEELAAAQGALSMFRESVHRWSAESGGAAIPRAAFVHNELPRVRRAPLRWAFAGLVLMLLIVIPIYKSSNDRKRAAQALEDTLLLERVNAQLSRRVPEQMEPLMKLISDPPAGDLGGRQ